MLEDKDCPHRGGQGPCRPGNFATPLRNWGSRWPRCRSGVAGRVGAIGRRGRPNRAKQGEREQRARAHTPHRTTTARMLGNVSFCPYLAHWMRIRCFPSGQACHSSVVCLDYQPSASAPVGARVGSERGVLPTSALRGLRPAAAHRTQAIRLTEPEAGAIGSASSGPWGRDIGFGECSARSRTGQRRSAQDRPPSCPLRAIGHRRLRRTCALQPPPDHERAPPVR